MADEKACEHRCDGHLLWPRELAALADFYVAGLPERVDKAVHRDASEGDVREALRWIDRLRAFIEKTVEERARLLARAKAQLPTPEDV